MRRSRSRRRIRFYLIAVCVTVVMSGVYDLEFGYTLTGLVEHRLNRLFPDDLTCEIGAVEGGVFRDIVSRDIRISHPQLEKPITLERIEMPFRVWYPLARKVSWIPVPERQGITIFFGNGNRYINGNLSLDGDLGIMNIRGNLSLFGKHLDMKRPVTVRGTVDLRERKGTLEAMVDHLMFNGTDIVANIRVDIEDHDRDIAYAIVIDPVIVNLEPVDIVVEARGVFDKATGSLELAPASLRFASAKEPVLRGTAKAVFRPETELAGEVVMNDIVLDEVIAAFGDDTPMRGVLNGTVAFDGPAAALRTRSHINVTDGRFGDFEFRSGFLTLEGVGPVLKVESGRIIKEGGGYYVAGIVNLGAISEGRAFDDLVIDAVEKIPVWDLEGWEISRKKDESQTIHAEKKLGDENMALRFETPAQQEPLAPESEQAESFLGVEHKTRF